MVVALQDGPAEEHWSDGRRNGDHEASTEESAGVEGCGLVEFMPTGCEVADHQCHARDQTPGEPAARRVVACQKQIEAEDHEDPEQESGDDFEHQ